MEGLVILSLPRPLKKNNNNLFKHSTKLNLHADKYYNLMLHISYAHNVTVF